jgi:hypothetical protein
VKKERSRSYPVLDLGTAYEILVGRLKSIETSSLDRDALAGVLGYSAAYGGIAARKISALVQYGMLDYRDGYYVLSPRACRLQSCENGSKEFLSALQVTLEKPTLFRSILSQYRPVGRIPEDLARVLTEKYGITARASEDAEAVFIRSAIFAQVLDVEGQFREITKSASLPEKEFASSAAPRREEAPRPALPLPVDSYRSASLTLPPNMTASDLEILEKRLQFEIENGTLWRYLGLKKSSVAKTLADVDNVVPIRPFRET